MYQIRDLRLSFPDMVNKPFFGSAPRVEVLKGLSFDLFKGAILGIVGGSGSGKSTLGRAMVRLLEPDAGTIHFDGIDISHADETELRHHRQRFQMIFQDPMSSLNPRHKVGRLIASPLKIHDIANPQKRTSEALEMVGLPQSFATRFPHELSGGQRQRIGIARAIALRPDFILADEIVSGLDVSSQAQVLNLLGNLVSELGLTLAFISHDLSIIRRLCTHVVVLNQGEIAEEGETSTLFDNPQTAYSKELLSAIPLPDPNQDWA